MWLIVPLLLLRSIVLFPLSQRLLPLQTLSTHTDTHTQTKLKTVREPSLPFLLPFQLNYSFCQLIIFSRWDTNTLSPLGCVWLKPARMSLIIMTVYSPLFCSLCVVSWVSVKKNIWTPSKNCVNSNKVLQWHDKQHPHMIWSMQALKVPLPLFKWSKRAIKTQKRIRKKHLYVNVNE